MENKNGSNENLDALLDEALLDFNIPNTNQPFGDSNNKVENKAILAKPKSQKVSSKIESKNTKSENKKAEENPCNNSQKLLFGNEDVEAALNEILNLSGEDFQSNHAISETMKRLSENTQNIESDLAEMLKNVDMNDETALFPFVEGALQTFISKEMLYPSMNEIREKYPAWIEKNKINLTAKQLESYMNQYQFIQQICVEFENQKDSDSERTKNARFKNLLHLMQKVNDCGDPPKELISGNLSPADLSAFSASSSNDPQCAVS